MITCGYDVKMAELPSPSSSEGWPSLRATALLRAPSDGARPRGPAEPFRSLGFTLSSLGYAVARAFTETLAPLQIEPRDFALLRAVDAAGGASQQAICERLGIPPSRMVGLLDAHEARGLIERRPKAADRRIHALHLTDDGQKLLARAFKLAVAYEQDLCGDLSEAEREQLLDLLPRVGGRLGLTPGVHAAAQGDDAPAGEE